jgi:hypothetical protein
MEKLWTTKSCRSRWKLQFSCKVYLHPSSNKKITNFWKQTGPLLPCPTVVGRCYSAARLLTQWGTVVGPCRRPPRRQMYSFTKFFADHIFLQKRGKKNEKKKKNFQMFFCFRILRMICKVFWGTNGYMRKTGGTTISMSQQILGIYSSLKCRKGVNCCCIIDSNENGIDYVPTSQINLYSYSG